jgi:predicted MFS family arabinose efflux permease
MIGLACLILGVMQGNIWGWNSAIIISLFVIAALALILFYKVETKTSAPIIQFHLFNNRMFITSIVATAALAFFYCVAFFLMPLYLYNIRGESSYMIGLMLLPTTATIALLSPVVGYLVDGFGPKPLLVVGLGLFVLSAGAQTQFELDSSLAYILFSFMLIGVGWACILGPSTVAALSSLPDNMGAVAMGSSWTLHNIGGAIGLTLGTVVYHVYARNALLVDLAMQHIKGNAWVDKVMGNPDITITLLQQYTHFSRSKILTLFNHSFLSGYAAAMWLLVASSLVACLMVFFGMKRA